MWNRSVAVVAALALTAGCTHWSSRTQYGPKQEVGRRLIGAPQIAESSESSLNAGFAGASSHDAGGGAMVAGLSGSSGTLKRTHCIQQAEVDFSQPFDTVPTSKGRVWDWVGSVALMLIGLGTYSSTAASQDTFWEPGDEFYEPPPDPTAGYITAGVLIGAGVAWIGYSYWKLPHQPAPTVVSSQRQWTETTFVEATGCGLVPGDVAANTAAPADDDTAARLEKLDKLHDSGVITDEEYARKRKELVDAL